MADVPVTTDKAVETYSTKRNEKAWAKVDQLIHDIIASPWRFGQALIEAKESTQHGAWLPYLERRGLDQSKCQRMMKVASEMTEAEFINEYRAKLTPAYKAIKAGKPAEPAGDDGEAAEPEVVEGEIVDPTYDAVMAAYHANEAVVERLKERADREPNLANVAAVDKALCRSLELIESAIDILESHR